MSKNGANNEQWRMAGSKNNNIGGVRDSENQANHNGAYSNEGERVLLAKSMKPGGRKVPTGSINKAGRRMDQGQWKAPRRRRQSNK
jgi:hypothetical protein